MALRVCDGCSTAYAVGLPVCPHCGGTDHHEEGTMPKITRHGGPTVAGEPSTEALPPAGDVERAHPGTGKQGKPVEATPDGTEHQLDADRDDKGGASSPGSRSSASSPRPPKSSAPNATSRPSPARTTESPSGQDRKGSSSARTTGGSGTA